MAPFQRMQDRRVVTVGNPGGLNERFGRLEQSTSSQPTNVKRSVISMKRTDSVFSRICASNSNIVGKKNDRSSIQNRLGKVSGGGNIRKRDLKQSVRSRLSTHAIVRNTGLTKRGKQTMKPQTRAQQIRSGNNRKKAITSAAPNKKKTNTGKKAVSADDLDKALDSYMMKDPKTAQAKLDDELNTYMDEAGDVLMDL
ncbi:uncharacterized protein BX664DRAFT_320752 [Halteromyces radiatus]|uniref:uncharacterized protein n=1 Tax=Halteromyces radiatus TaxID=101107 RepID=UPI00221E3916|nr:uncharacterized protein BX664DRAFT_320752 [Halteromyces radiatus]KAI8099237.1 hypothetical protein BX664DRAFT_320752 [Halteromyces radiatus]